MAITLTQEILQTSYTLLRQTQPFNRLKLPPASQVKFQILRGKSVSGDHCHWNGKHHIRISAAKHHTLSAVIMTMAHEMCHVADSSKSAHGAQFNRLADRVCKWHGFDRGQF
jgi:hypothetical protein